MKKFFIVAVIMVLAVMLSASAVFAAEAKAKAEASASADAKGKEAATPKSTFTPPTPYGHKDGVFWISKDLVAESGFTGTPKIISDATGWKWITMKSVGGYWVVKTDVKLPKAEYCFDIGNEQFIPHALMGKSTAINMSDVIDNHGKGGYNFLTSAVK